LYRRRISGRRRGLTFEAIELMDNQKNGEGDNQNIDDGIEKEVVLQIWIF